MGLESKGPEAFGLSEKKQLEKFRREFFAWPANISRWKDPRMISFPRFAWECRTDASRHEAPHDTGREASGRHSHAKRGNECLSEFSIC
ncbi:hypothetical protein [Desulfonema magnum]|uniref:Uncharacterized protein n=1 Tax=Desulfonema magnum TaxID=45655 RepID=A0A975BRP3_9BACT|nr:hypothetical protein [Desulfonema magnum]QTA90197.1 Uncharacterized protein dnm_062580 [Desulfonema magnum]